MKSQSTNIWKLMADALNPEKVAKRKAKHEKQKQIALNKKIKLIEYIKKYLGGDMKPWTITHEGWDIMIRRSENMNKEQTK